MFFFFPVQQHNKRRPDLGELELFGTEPSQEEARPPVRPVHAHPLGGLSDVFELP